MTRSDAVGSWWFDPARAGTMRTSGLRSLLEGAHLTGPEMFVREVTQNSVDARLDSNEPVVMHFSSYLLTPSQRRAMNDFLLGDGQVSNRLDTFKGQEQFAANGGFFGAENVEAETRVLLVEDFGTKGLGGSFGGDGPEDHFSRLVYFFGQSHEEGSRGGAFGFGKSVYSVASAVRTVIYYSKPEDKVPSRLIAVSLFPGHEYGGRRYTGYALCGLPGSDDSFPIEPIEGEAADELARNMGMQAREDAETGTSLLIVDCAYSAEDLKEALEKWWWPRLVTTGAHGLVATLFQDGRQLPEPNPVARADLEQLVKAYQHFLDNREDTPETKSRVLRSTHKRVVGKLTLRRVYVDPEVIDEESWHTHTVALIRGPKLVVQYAPFGRRHMPPFIGVFVADEAMDPVFRRAENPAHDTWAPESNRLMEDERPLVRAVEKYAKQFARDFQASFMAKPIAPTSRLRALEDLLGQMFNKGQHVGTIPPGADRPISLRVRESRDATQGFDEARIEIRPTSVQEPLPARLSVTAHLLADANRNRLDALSVELLDHEGRSLAKGNQAEHAFDLSPGSVVRFTARTSSPKESPVKFTVVVSGRPS